MNAGHGHQTGTTAVIELIQIRLVLEEVRIHPLLVHLDVRLDVVGEYLNVQFHTLFSQLRLHKFQDLRVGYGSCGYRQLPGSNCARESSGRSQCCECFLQIHKSILLFGHLERINSGWEYGRRSV